MASDKIRPTWKLGQQVREIDPDLIIPHLFNMHLVINQLLFVCAINLVLITIICKVFFM